MNHYFLFARKFSFFCCLEWVLKISYFKIFFSFLYILFGLIYVSFFNWKRRKLVSREKNNKELKILDLEIHKKSRLACLLLCPC